jgi:hypothetical protein
MSFKNRFAYFRLHRAQSRQMGIYTTALVVTSFNREKERDALPKYLHGFFVVQTKIRRKPQYIYFAKIFKRLSQRRSCIRINYWKSLGLVRHVTMRVQEAIILETRACRHLLELNAAVRSFPKFLMQFDKRTIADSFSMSCVQYHHIYIG